MWLHTLTSGKLEQCSPAARGMLLGAWLPHQFLNLRRKGFYSSLLSFFLLQLSQTPISGHYHPSSPMITVFLFTYIFPSLWYKPIFCINFMLISYPISFASLPLVFISFLHWPSSHILIQSFTSVKLNYQAMSWPPTLPFYIFRHELPCFLSCWSLSPMLRKSSQNSQNAYKNLIMIRFLMLFTNICLFFPWISHPYLSGLCLSCTFLEVGSPFDSVFEHCLSLLGPSNDTLRAPPIQTVN